AMGAFGLYTSAKGLPAAVRGPSGARVPAGAQAMYSPDGRTITGYQVPASGGNPAQVLDANGRVTGSIEGGPRSSLNDPKSAAPTRADQQRSRAKSACLSAAMFGAMTGIRAISMKGQGRTKDQACQAVRDLAAAGALDLPVTPSGLPDSSSGLSGGTESGSYGGAGGSESGAGGSGSPSDASGSTAGLSTSAIRDPNNMLATTPYGGCMGETACRNAALSEGSKPPRSEIAAADVNALKQSGLDRLLAPKAAELDMDKIEKQLASGGNLGGAVGAAMGGGAPLGAALGQLVNAAMADAEKLGTAYASGNPGLGAGGPTGDGAPMGLLGDQALGAASQTDFQKAPSLLGDGSCPADDIWHTNCAPNTTIFTIVSEKLMRSHDRVEKLPWARPINRELSSSP
ncbi:MAG TPA: hypothetical protein VM598_03260, partial [Bdellovibrionota bacterium]|nr:hypothetical protein [Bdellovibrionota bacterium]